MATIVAELLIHDSNRFLSLGLYYNRYAFCIVKHS
jgi:hypothetical protein